MKPSRLNPGDITWISNRKSYDWLTGWIPTDHDFPESAMLVGGAACLLLRPAEVSDFGTWPAWWDNQGNGRYAQLSAKRAATSWLVVCENRRLIIEESHLVKRLVRKNEAVV